MNILPAQEQQLLPSAPGQLGAEILRIERRLNQAGVDSAERHEALVRLARLRQLSGDLSGAAKNWLEAVASNPADDNARVAGAFCLTATGEWESAALVIQPMLASARQDTPAMLQARYLDACLRTWTTEDAASLVSLASNPQFAALHPMIYYTLWRSLTRNPGTRSAGGADSWKSRLIAEFPKSLEARAVAAETDGASSSVSAVHSPVWLLFPSIPASPPAAVQPPAPAVPPPIVPQLPPPPAVSGPAGTGAALQTGAFSREANARAEAERLQRAGFSAAVSRKNVNGSDLWVVTVPAGPDANKTMQELKKAGWNPFVVK